MADELIVVGGGAAGMMAAISAAETGAAVRLLERNPKVGRKLYITGKGRCNVTNHCPPEEVLALTNEITPEPIALDQSLNQLSGGQSRALMIADIALLCDSPIVLIDEIENAGIDKERALGLLQRRDKLVLVVTHDPHTALMSRRRIVMGGGAVWAVVERSPREANLYAELGEMYRRQQAYQALLRRGDYLT